MNLAEHRVIYTATVPGITPARVLSGSLNLLFCAGFCQTLFLPEFLSNEHAIWTIYSQSSQVC